MAAATGKDASVPAPHPPKFRRRAVELARQKTKPVAELAKELRISESCLRNWMAQADVDNSGSATPDQRVHTGSLKPLVTGHGRILEPVRPQWITWVTGSRGHADPSQTRTKGAAGLLGVAWRGRAEWRR